MNSMARRFGAVVLTALLMAAMLSTFSCRKNPADEAVSHTDDYQQAYVYAFPMIAAYKAMYQFNVDKTNPQYKGPFNTVLNTSQVFTPKDTAIVTPNSDTIRSCRWTYAPSPSSCVFRRSRKVATTHSK